MERFYIEVTPTDTENNRIRITKDKKKYFPSEDCEITVRINDAVYVCKFRLNSYEKDRSYLVLIGKQAMLKLNPPNIPWPIECQKIGEKEYVLTK